MQQISPSSNTPSPDAAALSKDLETIAKSAGSGQIDAQANFDAQLRIENLLKDPQISQEMKNHLLQVQGELAEGKVNMVDFFNVQTDISKL